MSKQYIENNLLWARQQKKISKLLEKPYEDLSVQEKLIIAYDKYYKHEKISYAEYEMIVITANDEIYFFYKDSEYQILHETKEITIMYINEYNGNQKISERSESYFSTIELLEKFRIDGKSIKDIWDDVTFSSLQ